MMRFDDLIQHCMNSVGLICMLCVLQLITRVWLCNIRPYQPSTDVSNNLNATLDRQPWHVYEISPYIKLTR